MSADPSGRLRGGTGARRLAGAAAAAALAIAPIAGAAELSRDAADSGAMQAVCGRCHTLQLVESHPRPEREWMETLQKMADLGANGTDEEFAGVVRYLRARLTLVNVNTAPTRELAHGLGVPTSVAEAIATRREQRKFRDLADLASIPGVDPAALNVRRDRIKF